MALYVDTKREKQDLPNAFTSFTEGFLSYRVPVAMTWMRARMDALTKSSGDAKAANDVLVQLTQEKARLQTALTDLDVAEIGAKTQLDTVTGSIITAGLDVDKAAVTANAALKSQDSQARTEAYKTDAGVFTARSASATSVSSKGRQFVDSAKDAIDQMTAALQNPELSDKQRGDMLAQQEDRLAVIKADLDRALGSSDPGEAQAAQNEIASYGRAASASKGVGGAGVSARVGGIFAPNAPEFTLREADVGVKGGVGMDTPKRIGQLAEAVAGNQGAWRMKNGGSSSSGGSSELTRDGGSEPGSDARAALKKGIDDIDELMRKVRADSESADPFRGLGGFFDPIPTKGSSSVRARTDAEEPPPSKPKKAKDDLTWEEEDLLPKKRRKKRSKQDMSVVFTSDATNDNRIV